MARSSSPRRPMRERFASKPGRHGTLYLFRITYDAPRDLGFGKDSIRLWAYDAEHAEMRFVESDEDGWWRVLSVERVRA